MKREKLKFMLIRNKSKYKYNIKMNHPSYIFGYMFCWMMAIALVHLKFVAGAFRKAFLPAHYMKYVEMAQMEFPHINI